MKSKKKSPLVSIIIRSKNEEKWIKHCIEKILLQTYKNIEIIVVDNESTDNTLNIVNRYKNIKVVTIKNFLPGLAINLGIRNSNGEYLVILSAHCIPKRNNWLEIFVNSLEENKNYAGVYGRQVPVSFTDPIDKRDLLMVFGPDRKIQIKDYFFHNANSIIRRNIWEKYPFDESVTNIEDRVWGKVIIENGYQLLYEPEASVYHHHGLHQGNQQARAKGVVSIIEKVDYEIINDLPISLHPNNINVIAILPIKDKIYKNSENFKLLEKKVKNLKNSKYLNNIYILSSQSEHSKLGVKWINRNKIKFVNELDLEELLLKTLIKIERLKYYPDSIIYINYEYLERPVNLIDDLITESQYKGFDTVFPGYVDYGHYWYKNDEGLFKQTDYSLKSRDKREPILRALYGLGCLIKVPNLRQAKLFGGKIGIYQLNSIVNTFRIKDADVFTNKLN